MKDQKIQKMETQKFGFILKCLKLYPTSLK